MTIRTRLTLLFTATVALLLILFSIIIYQISSANRIESFSQDLRERVNILGIIVLDANELDSTTLVKAEKRFANKLHDEQVAVVAPDDKHVYVSNGELFIPTRNEIKQAHRSKFYTSTEQDTQKIFTVYEDEGLEYILAIKAYDSSGIEALHSLGRTLFIGVVVSLVLISIVGWWFVRRALSPVEEMRLHADSLSAHLLHERIDEGNGKDELAKLAHSFNNLFERIDESISQQKRFIAYASHELRTPLTSLAGQIEVALMKLRTPIEYESVLRDALDSTNNLRDLVNDLLLLTQVESTSFTDKRTRIRMDDVVLSSIEKLQQIYQHRTISISYKTIPSDDREMEILGVEQMIRTAIYNILDNALKYSSYPSPVLIELIPQKAELIIEVKDQGIGILPEEHNIIFTPFQRSDRVHNIAGTGLGLYLVKTILERHGGSIRLSANSIQGTVATLSLPIQNN